MIDNLKKALAERVRNAKMDHHLAGEEPGNRRNGYGKHDPYGIEVSTDLISAVTDAVLEEVAAWQARPLEAIYPLVFFDALRVNIRDAKGPWGRLVRNKAIHIALGVRAADTKEILGLWLEQNAGAKFWLRVMNELKNCGFEDVLVAVVDGLKGFPEATTAVFPQATVQTCIVHLLRHSLGVVSWNDRKPVAAALKGIYRAVDATAGDAALTAFEESAGASTLRPGAISPATRPPPNCSSSASTAPRTNGSRAARVGHGQVPVRPPVRRARHNRHGLIPQPVAVDPAQRRRPNQPRPRQLPHRLTRRQAARAGASGRRRVWRRRRRLRPGRL